MLSILIPARNEKYLQQTIDELLKKTEGEIEIIAILENYWPNPALKEDRRLKIIHFSEVKGLRNAVNAGAAIAQGEYLMKCDAHCMFDQGYDRKLLADIKDDWVVIPRRYKLDTDEWRRMDEEGYIDYDKIVVGMDRIHGQEWISRRKERENILVDETPVFQGSCWVMSRKHWDRLGGLQEYGYGKFTQEPLEIAMKTWLDGGSVVVNKKTWYAHQHRKFKRAYRTNQAEVDKGNAYSRNYWTVERKKDLEKVLTRFGL